MLGETDENLWPSLAQPHNRIPECLVPGGKSYWQLIRSDMQARNLFSALGITLNVP